MVAGGEAGDAADVADGVEAVASNGAPAAAASSTAKIVELEVETAGANGAPGAAAPITIPEVPREEAAVIDLDSEEEEELVAVAEMELPPGLLEEEFADEPEREDKDKGRARAGAREEDAERLPKDPQPYPSLPPRESVVPSDARKKAIERVKQQAGEALARGDVNLAVDTYTQAIRSGGATALMLATRGALLLKQRRPCAAIRDCCAALVLNPDCGKAYHVRGVAHRKLGHWKKAHRDLSQGQRLDFSEDSVNVHMFVASKVGVLQDQRTGGWYQNEGAKKAVEKLLTPEGPDKKKKKGPSANLRVGQAVRINGLLKAPHLNGKRGIIQRLNPNDSDRWDVELRLELGKVEVKAIRSENIVVVRAADAQVWKVEEQAHEEERRRREKDEKRWQEEEEKRRRLEEKRKETERSLRAGGFPEMDVSEKLEAEMSSTTLDEDAMRLLRRLKSPQEALDLLHQAQASTAGGNISHFIKIKVRQRLGDPDSDDEEETRRRAEQAVRAAAEVAAKVEARIKSQVAAEERAKREADARREKEAQRAASRKKEEEEEEYNPEDGPEGKDSSEDSSEDEDFDRLEEEKETLPDTGHLDEQPTEEQSAALAKFKKEAVDALESGDVALAIEKYTEVIKRGGATSLMLAKRGELLLKQRRPLAAVRDCTAALAINPDMGKAYRIRGIAQRKLGRWAEAHNDLVEGQRMDYDEGTAAVQKFVAEKVRVAEEKAARAAKRRKPGATQGGPATKRAR